MDEGAERAGRRRGSSLLAVGVVRCEGAVRAGDGVELCGPDGVPFGRGISSLDAKKLEAWPSNVGRSTVTTSPSTELERGWCARRRNHPRPDRCYGTIFSTSPTSGAVLKFAT